MSPGWAAVAGLRDGVLQRLGVDDLSCAFDLRFDLVRGRADRVHALHPLAQQIVQHRVVAAFIFAAENQVNVAGKDSSALMVASTLVALESL